MVKSQGNDYIKLFVKDVEELREKGYFSNNNNVEKVISILKKVEITDEFGIKAILKTLGLIDKNLE